MLGTRKIGIYLLIITNIIIILFTTYRYQLEHAMCGVLCLAFMACLPLLQDFIQENNN